MPKKRVFITNWWHVPRLRGHVAAANMLAVSLRSLSKHATGHPRDPIVPVRVLTS
jgi:hypothetical protein